METITIKQENKLEIVRFCYLFLCMMTTTVFFAQVHNNGSLFIGDGGTFYVASGNYTFGSGGSTQTSRTETTYGKLIVASVATTSGASNSHFLNGYGSIRTNSPFTLPLGDAGVYAPVVLTPSSTNAVDAAYVRGNPSSSPRTNDLDVTVGAVSDTEFWNIKGTNDASITLSWGAFGASSNLSNIVGTAIENLTIVGYNAGKWVKIPSTVDATSILGGASSVTTGSITSTSEVDLSSYEYFSIGSIFIPLSNQKFQNSGVVATLNDNVIAVQASLPLTGIEVYDLTGKKILESRIENLVNFSAPFFFPQSVYIVKAKLNNGTVASFKLINMN